MNALSGKVTWIELERMSVQSIICKPKNSCTLNNISFILKNNTENISDRHIIKKSLTIYINRTP